MGEAISWVEERKMAVGIILLGMLLMVFFLVFHNYFKVNIVYVSGNTAYTREEIIDMVMSGYLGNNSLYLKNKYRNQELINIPFVQSMDVVIESHDTVRIMVYEKPLAGYIDYFGCYMYFDKDGVVVESATFRKTGIPEVAGLDFKYIALYEPLFIGNEAIFQQISRTTQTLAANQLSADKIYFDSQYNMTLYYNQAKVKMGTSENLELKVKHLKAILPEIIELKGSLNLSNLTQYTKSVTFQQSEG
ncbi:MAG: cell division protein FtsQ/DivIB [Eubacteriales bacterium]